MSIKDKSFETEIQNILGSSETQTKAQVVVPKIKVPTAGQNSVHSDRDTSFIGNETSTLIKAPGALNKTRTNQTVPVSSTQLSDNTFELQNDEQFDPFQGLDHLSKVKAQYSLANNSIVPFDQSNYLQVMTNPLAGFSTNTPEEIITVQIFKPSLRKYDEPKGEANTQKKLNQKNAEIPRAKCLKSHLLNLVTVETQLAEQKCAFCDNDIAKGQLAYTCKENSLCNYFLCQACNIKFFIRRQLVEQNEKLHFYEHFELEAVKEKKLKTKPVQNVLSPKEGQKVTSPTSSRNQVNKIDTIEQIERDASALNVDEEKLRKKLSADASVQNAKKEQQLLARQQTAVTSKSAHQIKFANVVPEDEGDIHNQSKEFKTYVVVSLWRQDDDHYRCYRMFKIDSPAFLKIQEDAEENFEKAFLHRTQDGNLIYFTKNKQVNKESHITCHYFDLQKAMKAKDSEFVRNSSMLFAAPVIQHYTFKQGSKIQSLLEHILIDKADQELTSTFLRFLSIGASKLMIVKSIQAINSDEIRWTKTLSSNLIFIDMVTQEVPFIIHNADLLLEVKTTQDGQKPNEVLFVQGTSIVLMEWGSPAPKELTTRKMLETNIVTQQPCLKTYQFMPAISGSNFKPQFDELISQINGYSKQNMIQGRLHTNKTRVSIIYCQNSLMTFELVEGHSLQQESKFYGTIGEVKDFTIENLVIKNQKDVHAQGQDATRGKYLVKGEVQSTNIIWSGFANVNGSQQFFQFDQLSILSDGKIMATGQDAGGAYKVSGAIGEDKKTASFVKEYFNSQTKQFFVGVINPDKTKIAGTWGNSQGESIDKFQISAAPDLQINFKIEYANSSWINLQGVLQREKAKIIGTFTVSDDLAETFLIDSFNPEKNTFELIGYECQNRAIKLFSSTDLCDAQFCHIKSKDAKKNIYVGGNLKLKNTTLATDNGYSNAQFDVFDLDGELDFKTKKVLTLHCLVPSNFREVTDEFGEPKLPYYNLTPFNIKQIDADNYAFQTQMFYQDSLQNTKKILFLQGTGSNLKKSLSQNSNEILLPQWPPVMYENFIVIYPILAYKSNLASDNELVICNLIQNLPQKFVNLSPYRFVQFVETGLVPERYLHPNSQGQAVNTSIYFLVEYKSIMYMMCYRCFPWPVDRKSIYENDLHKFQFEDQIQLLTGSFDPAEFKQHVNKCNLTPEKIQTATMLQRPSAEGVQMITILQLFDEIICINFNKPTYFQKASSKEMLKLMMQRGPAEQIYFAEKNELSNDQLSQLTFVSRDQITKKCIYSSDGAQILSFQVEYNTHGKQQKNVYPHCIYMLDSEKKMRRFQISGSQEDTDIVTDLTLNLSNVFGIQKIINLLQTTYWNKVLLNENGVVALQAGKKANELVCTVMSTKSNLQSKHEYLGFADDKKYTLMKQGRRTFEQDDRQESIFSVNIIPWLGKNIYEVKESKNNYFLLTSQLWSRTVEMMRVDTDLTMKEDQILLANNVIGIKFQMTNQYMLFSQTDYTFKGTLYYQKIKQLSEVANDSQYFQVYLDKFSPSNVMKYDQKGEEVLLKHVDEAFKLWSKSYLDDFNTAYQAEDLQWAIQIQRNMLGIFIYQYGDVTQNMECDICGDQVDIFVTQFKEEQTVGLIENFTNSFFVLQCNSWQKLSKNETRQNFFTKDYMVIKHGPYVCFIKFQEMLEEMKQWELQEMNGSGNSKRHSISGMLKMPNSARKSSIFNSPQEQFQYKLNKFKASFKVINTDKLDKRITNNGFKIIKVAQYDLIVAEKGENRTNVIQLSFSDMAIMWDLDENKEVTFLTKQSVFANPHDYVATGFIPHLMETAQNRQMNSAVFFTQNENRSLLLTPETKNRNSQLIRTYTAINLMEVFAILRCQQNNLFVSQIDTETILQNFNGLTFFQIFKDNPDYFELFEKIIVETGVKNQVEIDETGQESDNLLIRKIYWTLNLPVIQEGMDHMKGKVLRPNILQSIVFDDENHHMLDAFLRLTMLAQEFRLSNLVGNFECFKQVFDNQSPEISNFLTDSFFQTPLTQEIHSTKWNPDHSLLTFGSFHSLLNQDQIEEAIEKEQRKKLSFIQKLQDKFWPTSKVLESQLKMFPVNVRILEIEWLSDNLGDFYTYLNGISDNEIFGNEFIKVLLEQQNYSRQLLIKVFIPYIIYMICSLVYFSEYVPSHEVKGGFFGQEGFRTQAGLRCYIFIFALLFLFIEIKQMVSQGLGYFFDVWNYIYWSANILAIVIVIEHGVQNYLDTQQLIQMASFAIVLQWLMLYYWLRLFPELAFYVTMIQETVVDISNFFLMFLMCVAMFANAVYVLNKMEPADQSDAPNEPIYAEAFREPFIDSFFNQYLLGLGDFAKDNYTAHPANVLIYIYFILATLFTQIMFLNMLIAIMGETFGRVTEAKDRSALMERTHLYADFLWGITLTKELQGKRYLYVVRPVHHEEEDQNTVIQSVQSKISEVIEKNQNSTQEEISNLQKKVQLVISQHHNLKESVEKRIDNMNNEMQDKLDAIMRAVNANVSKAPSKK